MSNSSFRNIIDVVKDDYHSKTANERNYWDGASPATRSTLLNLDTYASENAYQQENTARFNQLINTNYDSLPESVKASITEALIIQGELPNPSDFKGIGHEFIANPTSLEKEVFTECDRCDEIFMAEEDFNQHKAIDHGDITENFEQSEEQYVLSMNPDLSREALRNARRILAEGTQKDLYRDSIYNYKEIKTPTLKEPKSDGKVGYNDNPNAGLYDTKKFKDGTSKDRVALEAEGLHECPHCGAFYENKKYFDDHLDDHRRTGEAISLGGAPEIFSHMVVSDPSNRDQPFFAKCDHCGYTTDSVYPDMKNHLKNEHDIAVEGYELDMEDPNAKYDERDSLSDITNVAPEPISDPAKSLEGLDFAEETIEFVYPTKATEAFVEEKDPFIDGYADDDIESDKEAVENQITSRKLHGHGADAIARELSMQYGVSPEEALERVNAVEVSINDKVANTFFGKRFNECTPAEINELKLYSGSDE